MQSSTTERVRLHRRKRQQADRKREREAKRQSTTTKPDQQIAPVQADSLSPTFVCSLSPSPSSSVQRVAETVSVQLQDDSLYLKKSSIRNNALTNIFQFRVGPTGSPKLHTDLQSEMNTIREQVYEDLSNNIGKLNPSFYFVCNACGHEVKRDAQSPSPFVETKWRSLLSDKLYTVPQLQPFVVCKTCWQCLRAPRIPCQALVKGWVFADEVPPPLRCLSKHEKLLVALRLPCIYIWKAQGGFGQFASKGAPVSFANPVAELSKSLLRRVRSLFPVLLENGQRIDVNVHSIRNALDWLMKFNPLYSHISLDEGALAEISSVHENTEMGLVNDSSDTTIPANTQLPAQIHEAAEAERRLGTHGHLDEESIFYLKQQRVVGVDDAANPLYSQMLIRHILKPFKHRRNHMIPSYDASQNLESYFPTLFPYGQAGPSTTGTNLAIWTKHVLSVHESRFAKDIDFIFFICAVLHRKRLSGLSLHAPFRSTCTKAVINVRDLLQKAPDSVITSRIDKLMRSGSLNASFEKLKGSPALWASLKRSAWVYLAAFGPCQLFMTISAADLADPFVFMHIDKSLTFEDASCLSSRDRAALLANNPVSAATVFHRRVSSIFEKHLLGETRPFGTLRAYLGRIEQQSRHSPHLHLLIWLENTGPDLIGNEREDGKRIANFIELFCTALLPTDYPKPQSEVPDPLQTHPMPLYIPNRQAAAQISPLSGYQRHAALARKYNPNAFDGSVHWTKLRIALAEQF